MQRKIASILVIYLIMIASIMSSNNTQALPVVDIEDFPYYHLFTINKTYTPVNMPFLPLFVNITIDPSHVTDINKDIVFLDVLNSVIYPHEVELYNPNTGRLNAWVNVSNIQSSVNTQFLMALGNDNPTYSQNREAVWDGNYVYVCHFNGSSYSTCIDSTSNHIAITGSSGTVYYQFKGNTGYSIKFADSGSPYLSYSTPIRTTFPTTLNVWYNFQVTGTTNYVVTNGAETGTNKGFSVDRGYMGMRNTSLRAEKSMPAISSLNTWFNYNARWDGTSNTAYFGVNKTYYSVTPTSLASSTTQNLKLGISLSNSYPLKGNLDELRISKVVRNDSYMNMIYDNMRTPFDFMFYSAEMVFNKPPINKDPFPNDEVVISCPNLTITIQDPEGALMRQSFRTNVSGSWQTLCTYENLSNCTRYCNLSCLYSNMTVWWSSNVSDGETWTNNTYNFCYIFVKSNALYVFNNTENVTGYYQAHYNNSTGWVLFMNYSGIIIVGNGTGTYNLTLLLQSLEGMNFTVIWTGDINTTGNNINFSVNKSMNITGTIEVIDMEIIFDIGQIGLVFLTLLTMFCIFVGYLMNNSTGGVFLLVSSGLIFNLLVFVGVYFSGIFALAMTPLFVALLVLFIKDGMIRLKNKNPQNK